MGRRVPYGNANNSLIESFLYFSFSFVALAASIAIIITLCSVRFRRRKSPATPESQPHTLSNPLDATETMKNSSTTQPPTTDTQETTYTNATIFISQEQPLTSEATKLENTLTEGNNNETSMKELPLPPSMQQANNIDSQFMKRVTSERKLSFSLSMKLPRSLSLAKNCNRKEENDIVKKEKIKGDESVWMKTIILGEKCMPDEEEDVVIYEGKGKKVSAYHPRNSISSTSVSLSRQWSSIALDVPQSHEEKISKI